MNGLLRETLAARRFTLTRLSTFTIAALVLASVGLYGLVSFAVDQRTNEIGIRMALGARAGAVLAMVMRQGMMVAAAGVAGGLVASAALTSYLTTMLFGVSAADPATYAGLATVMAIVSALACYVPARRASIRSRRSAQSDSIRQPLTTESSGSGAFSTGSRNAATCRRNSS